MIVRIANNIVVENPTPQILDWCKKELTLSNPEYEKKARMGFWVGNTPRTLSLYEQRDDSVVVPYGLLRKLPDSLKQATIMPRFAAAKSVEYGGIEVPLYDYQQDAVDALYKAHFGIIQSAAGSGKTQIGIALAKRYGTRCLWLTHTADLLRQSKERAERYINSDVIGTITEGKVSLGSGITFATIQTMAKLDLPQYRDYWDLIIVDECHRVAGTPTALTMFYRVLNNLSARHKYGLSATVHRADGMIKATYALLGDVVYVVPEEAIADRVMQVGIMPILTGTPMSHKALNTDGTLNYTRLINYLSTDTDRSECIVKWLLYNRGRSCLILSDRLHHLQKMMDMLPEDMRADACMINGKMTSKKGKEERERAIAQMRTGEKKYLFASFQLCKEGLDIPRLERLFLATPVKDYTVVVQSIGRIARVFEGKADPIVYDFVDNIGYLQKAYKTRCRHYRAAGAYFV